MKKIALIMVGMMYGAMLFGQDKPAPNGPGKEKLETMKIAMITNRLDLKQEQAANFWAVYNEYEAKKRDIKASLRNHFSETSSLTSSDEKIMSEVREIHNLRQKEVDLDKEYMTKLLKVINARQLVELYKAEHSFKQMLLRRFEGPPQAKMGPMHGGKDMRGQMKK